MLETNQHWDWFIGEATVNIVTSDFCVFCTWGFDDEANARSSGLEKPSFKGKLINQSAREELKRAAKQVAEEARGVFLANTTSAECDNYTRKFIERTKETI